MSKLIRYILVVMVFVALSHEDGFAQRRILVPVQPQPYGPVQRPVQRYNQTPRNQAPRNQNQLNVIRNGGGKKTQAIKESFLSQRLNLTSKEGKAFWPLYRRYTEELTAVRILKRQNNSNESVDGSEQVKKDLEYESQIVAIKKTYSDQFLRILPPEKVSILYKAEREFNDEVFRILSEKSIRAGD